MVSDDRWYDILRPWHDDGLVPVVWRWWFFVLFVVAIACVVGTAVEMFS